MQQTIRPMRPDDWTPVTLEAGRYFNTEPLVGFRRRDGTPGSVLHPIHGDDAAFETILAETFRAVKEAHPSVQLARYHVRMPYWRGEVCPTADDYTFVSAPERLTTTAITVVLIPQHAVRRADLGFYFHGLYLPPLRQRMRGEIFRGIVGNVGFFMTEKLIRGAIPWAHNRRFTRPAFRLPTIKAYLGFHLFRDADGHINAGFQGAHPAAVAVRNDGTAEILPRLKIAGYTVTLAGVKLSVEAINDPHAEDADIALFTPSLWTEEVAAHVDRWQRYAPTVPLADAAERIHLFITNEGNGRRPVERVYRVWEGTAPIPSFGGVLSLKRHYAQLHFGDATRLEGEPVHILPWGATPFHRYRQMLGGLVPAVVDGEHLYLAHTVPQVLERLQRHANALSPIAQAGRETQNFDPHIREPAGLIVQTADQIGWVLFDGRHELSLGAGVVDAAVLLAKLQAMGALGEIKQAVFIDGGSAMKAYAVESDADHIALHLLNRVAAGGRNGPGYDPDGLNLYTLLRLHLNG